MYDDDRSIGSSNYYYKVAKFPTKNIKTPIILVYGGSDSLVDIKVMLKELPQHTTLVHEIPHFEHLDFLWAQDVKKLVFPVVFAALARHAQTKLMDDKRAIENVLFDVSEAQLRAEFDRQRQEYNGYGNLPNAQPGETMKLLVSESEDDENGKKVVLHARHASSTADNGITSPRQERFSTARPRTDSDTTASGRDDQSSINSVSIRPPSSRKDGSGGTRSSAVGAARFGVGGIRLGKSRVVTGGTGSDGERKVS